MRGTRCEDTLIRVARGFPKDTVWSRIGKNADGAPAIRHVVVGDSDAGTRRRLSKSSTDRFPRDKRWVDPFWLFHASAWAVRGEKSV